MTQLLYCTVFMILYLYNDDNTVLCSQKGVAKITKSCPTNDTMEMKGYDVKLSDFVKANGDIYNLCSSKAGLKVVKVFASNKLVVDRDVDVKGSHLKLFFLAPKWVVIGIRRVAVDGAMGTYMPRAKNGTSSKMTGEDGKPGLPGGPGGNFFGRGKTFVDGHHLVVTSNGGIGGTGQFGGHGFDQKIGRYPNVYTLGQISCGLYYDICRGKEKKYQLNLRDHRGSYSDFVCEGLYEENNMERCSYRIFGWKGEEGGKGGNGGRGGMGGLPGKVQIVAVDNDSHNIATYAISGKRGMNGEGGIGGKGGENGYNVIYTSLFFLSPPKIQRDRAQQMFHRLGPNGTDGYNSVGYKEDRKAPDNLEPSEVEHVVTEYEAWLKENSH